MMTERPTNPQPPPSFSQSKLDLIEEKEYLKIKLKKQSKKEKRLQQKINKLMYFFFKIQQKGVPIYEMYQEEGLEKIYTDRFDEIMALYAQNEQEKENLAANDSKTASFFTEDSYEDLEIKLDFQKKQQNRPLCVPKLSLEELPGYATSSESEGYDENDQQQKSNEESEENSMLKLNFQK